MSLFKAVFKGAAAAALAFGLAACDRGPMEKAGKSIDNAADKVGDKVKDATK